MDGQIDLNLIIEKAGVKPGMTVAEFGCGNGHLSRLLARTVTNTGIVYAVDVMKDVLENLNKICNLEGIQNVRTIWSDLEVYGATNISNEIVDIGFIVNTFFQTNKERDFLEEVLRMIKPGGKVMVVDWLDEAVSIIAPKREDRTGVDKLKKICSNFKNIKIEEIFSVGKDHYGVIIVKNK